MHKYHSRLFAILLGLVSLCTAQVAVAPSSGNGSQINPYQISSLANLLWIQQDTSRYKWHYVQSADIDAAETKNWNNGMGWMPIGLTTNNYRDRPFNGSYDGNGHSIENLHINQSDSNHIGLFRNVKLAIIRNIHLKSASVYGKNYVGALVGYSDSATIINCHVTGKVEGYASVGGLLGLGVDHSKVDSSSFTGQVSGYSSIGGLIGSFGHHSLVEHSHSGGSMTATYGNLGGFVGHAYDSTFIIKSSSTADVSGTAKKIGGFVGQLAYSTIIEGFAYGNVNGLTSQGTDTEIGGLVGTTYPAGSMSGYLSRISKSAFLGKISGNYVGALVGFATDVLIELSYTNATLEGSEGAGFVYKVHYAKIENSIANTNGPTDMKLFNKVNYFSDIKNSYASGKGSLWAFKKCSYNEGEMTSSYYLLDTITQSQDDGTRASTTEMKTQSTFVGWDFDSLWYMDEIHGFPDFQWKRAQRQYIVSFYDQDSSYLASDTVFWSQKAEAPTPKVHKGLLFSKWSSSLDSIIKNQKIYAVYQKALAVNPNKKTSMSFSYQDQTIQLNLPETNSKHELLSIEILDIQGNVLWSTHVKHTHSSNSYLMSTPAFPSGAYMVRVQGYMNIPFLVK